MKRCTAALLIVLSVCTTVSSQGWNKIDFPSTDKITGAYFVHPDTGYLVTSEGKCYRTFNAGGLWENFQVTFDGTLEDLYFFNADTGFVCGQAGALYVTYDAGYTWENKSFDDTSAWLFDMEMFSQSHGMAIGLKADKDSRFGGFALRTTDGGKNWKSQKSLGMGYSRILTGADSTVYLVSFGRLHVSRDFGRKWESRVTHEGSPARTLAVHGKTMVLAGMGGTIYYSHDRGQAWSPSQQDENKLFLAAVMVNGSVGFVGGINPTILRTADGGRTWNEELLAISPFQVHDLFLIGNRIYAVGSEGNIIYKEVR